MTEYEYTRKLEELNKLKSSGLISDAEYEVKKAKILVEVSEKEKQLLKANQNGKGCLGSFGLIIVLWGLYMIFSDDKPSKVSNDNSIYIDKVRNKLPNRKNDIFNNVDALRDKLSNNNIGRLTEWKYLEPNYWCHNDYFEFGTPTVKFGLSNNIAYYLESDGYNCVQALKIIVNINNKKERSKALKKLQTISEKTFISISEAYPGGLSAAILKGTDFKFENNSLRVFLYNEKSQIDTYILKIEAKSI